MPTKPQAMVMAAFLADSQSLGVHWIYNTGAIAKRFGRVDRLLPPLPNSYHAGKSTGDLTHYGDQLLVLLESVAAAGSFLLDDFAARWRNLFADYHGYIDGATSGTLANFAAGLTPDRAGSRSNDLAGATRLAPVVLVDLKKRERLADDARAQTALTHSDPLTLDAAEFYALVLTAVLDGMEPVAAMEQAAAGRFAASPLAEWTRRGLDSAPEESVPAISRFGQSCHTPEAFPCVAHLVARYQDDFKEALVQNAMAGGDSAARGMIVGSILAAFHGPEALPQEWLDGLNQRSRIEDLLSRIA